MPNSLYFSSSKCSSYHLLFCCCHFIFLMHIQLLYDFFSNFCFYSIPTCPVCRVQSHSFVKKSVELQLDWTANVGCDAYIRYWTITGKWADILREIIFLVVTALASDTEENLSLSLREMYYMRKKSKIWSPQTLWFSTSKCLQIKSTWFRAAIRPECPGHSLSEITSG